MAEDRDVVHGHDERRARRVAGRDTSGSAARRRPRAPRKDVGVPREIAREHGPGRPRVAERDGLDVTSRSSAEQPRR